MPLILQLLVLVAALWVVLVRVLWGRARAQYIVALALAMAYGMAAFAYLQ